MFVKNRFIPRAWESGPKVQSRPGDAEAPLPWKSILLAGVGFFLLTAAIPLSERLIPDRYQGMTVESVLASLAIPKRIRCPRHWLQAIRVFGSLVGSDLE